jgi:Zn-dependent protease with chaperone function
MAIYAALTVLAPPLLSRPRLILNHPVACIRLWLLTFVVAAVSISIALGLFIAAALRHHVTHVAGHDTVGPLVDQFLGWLAIAVVGVLAFRLGTAVQDARSAVAQMTGEFAHLFAGAHITLIGDREIWRVESSIPLVGARSGRVVATSAMLEILNDAHLAAVIEHEYAHISHRHARIVAIANLAEAIAPALRAGQGFGSAARITAELIADDVAAARCGISSTAEALLVAYPDAAGVPERVTRLRNRL